MDHERSGRAARESCLSTGTRGSEFVDRPGATDRGTRLNAPTSTRILHRSRDLTLGEFRSFPEDPRWLRRSATSSHLIAIPRTCSLITQAGRDPVVATPNEAILYNARCEYTCQILSPTQELTTFLSVSTDALIGAMREFDPGVQDRPHEPWLRVACPTSASTFATFASLSPRRLRHADALEVEELSMSCLRQVVADAHPGRRSRPAPYSPAGLTHAHDVQEFLAREFRGSHSLADIARIIGVSSFHLCHAFRAATGTSIHAYRNDLRLRVALEEILENRFDLSRIALGLGFADQSHFCKAFSRCFGVGPSRVRRTLRAAPRRK